MNGGLKIDIGCGGSKREGFVGIDVARLPTVDYIVDVTTEPLPFPDASVSHVFSAHFFEHIGAPNLVLSEIGRVCADGAKIEIIMPYAFSDDAFVYGHVTHLTELQWMHFCVTHRDAHLPMLGGRWQLDAVNFVVPLVRQQEIAGCGFSLDFALKYFKGVAVEMCLDIEFRRDLSCPAVMPIRSYSAERFGERVALP